MISGKRQIILTLTILVLVSAMEAYAASPVKNAESAVAIAKEMCRGKADPSLKWHADLDNTGKIWTANTSPSLKKSGDPLWVVDIPVNGTSPSSCVQSLYTIVDVNK